MRTKLEEFRTNFPLLSLKPDIIVFVETNLCDNINDSELGLEQYNIYGRDRHESSGTMKGGGILMAINKKISSIVILCDYNLKCEQLFVKLKIGSKHIIIGAAYIPPLSCTDIYECHVNTVEAIYQNYHEHCDFIVVVDYNLPKTSWINGADVDESLNVICCHDDNLIRTNSTTLVNSFSHLNFTQMINVHANKGYTLDLCFTSLELNEIENQVITEPLFSLDRYHDPTLLSLNLAVIKFIEPVFSKKKYCKAKFDEISNFINEVD